MKNNKIYYWIEFVFLGIGIIYTVNLYLFKQSIKTISEKHYESIFEKIYTIIRIPDYSFYFYIGFILLDLLIACSIYYVIENKEDIFKAFINYLMLLSNIVLVIIVASIFNDPIFTIALVMFGVTEMILGLFYGYKQ
ncbi:hypothetical protein [Lactococcus lactis]|uniref:hypothetical protein n=1 Tax=Lactococcus lactis TaxID=1358 RepID=UPI001F55F4AC|nr:hypothetical protein [Lactococcus lactis]